MFPSSRPHLALMACCFVAAVLLSFLLVMGWRRHLDRADRSLTVLKADEALGQRPQPPIVVRKPKVLTPPPAPPTEESLKLSDLARSQEAPLFPEPVLLSTPISPVREFAAHATLQRFLQAETWLERLPLVVDSDRVRSAMRDFYEVRRHQDPRAEGPSRQAMFRINNTEVLLYSFASARPGAVTDVALTARDGSPFKVDWESFVGASEMIWPDFKKQRTTEPQLFRVFAQVDDYYNYEFSDTAKSISVHLTSPDGLYFIYGFCARDSAVGQTLTALQSSGPSRMALTLRLAFPPEAESDHCVSITGVVANRWLLVP